jgi:hyperosmotically inducible protein
MIKKIPFIIAVTLLTLTSAQVFAVEPIKKDDASITTTITEKLKKDKVTANSVIQVQTNKAVVFLSGTVKTEEEALSAIQLANSIPGVKDVESDNLKVQGSTHLNKDAYLTAKIKGAYVREKLFGNKPINLINITIVSKNGLVRLTGVVDSAAKKQEAIKLVREINGVKRVEPHIDVQPK